jgi:hypothetical protein
MTPSDAASLNHLTAIKETSKLAHFTRRNVYRMGRHSSLQRSRDPAGIAPTSWPASSSSFFAKTSDQRLQRTRRGLSEPERRR